ncbi:alpha/beta hydrolase [Anoxybacillus ayderensis]|nr:dUTPase [Anoxybacillus sp. ST70]THD16127.1 alpha/beta hydrolase [Anoxybacillus ayderensis]
MRRLKNLKRCSKCKKELDERIIAERNIDKTLDDWVIAITIAMESEIDEIRREVNWKWWKQEKEVDIDRLQEEVIDLWHFLLSLSRMVDLTPETIFEKYMAKNKINHQRQEQGY